MPAEFSDHVIVCGVHDEGLRVVEQLLQAGLRVAMVDDEPEPRLVESLRSLSVPVIPGDSREAATLSAAGVGRAKAVVCVGIDDLHTLATALLARELGGEARVVAQLRNAAVGTALEEIGVQVLDVADLAAPAITDACLGSGAQRLTLGGHEFAVATARCDRTGTLRELFGDLFPVGIIAGDSAKATPSPGRDHLVAEGDQAVLLGSHDAIRAAGLGEPDVGPQQGDHYAGARAPRPQSGPGGTGKVLRALRFIDARVVWVLGALGALMASSVAVLTLGYREPDGVRMSPLDAIYFTLETLTTVGFGDFYFRDQAPWLRAWAIALMITGALAVAVFFALFTNLLIGRTIRQALGRLEITGMKNHVVVVGAGSVGVAVIERLRALNRNVVVVDADTENRFLGQLQSEHIPFISADATLADTLDEVRLKHAAAVAVLTSDDLVNIETGLAVRAHLAERWRDVPVILRMFDSRLALTVQSSFGFRHVRSPAALAAPWFVGAALGLDVLRTFYVGDLPMLVVRFTAAGRLAGVQLSQFDSLVRIAMIDRGDGTSEPLPRRHAVIGEGDSVFAIGPYDDILAMVRDHQLA